MTATGSDGFVVHGPNGTGEPYVRGADKAGKAVEALREQHGLTNGPLMQTPEEAEAMRQQNLGRGVKAREVLTAKKAPVIAAWAAEHNMTPPEYEKVVAVHLKSLIDKGDFATRTTPDKLESILNDGSFKTIHDVGQEHGMGATAHRRDAENAFFGHNPVYGYVGTAKEPNALKDYGNVKIVFKKDAVAKDTTFLRGDSLPAHIAALEGNKAGAVAAPVDKPDVYSVAGYKAQQDPLKATLEKPSGETRTQLAAFMELQFKQPKVDDIERIDLSEPPSEALKAALAKRGIKYTVAGKPSAPTMAREGKELELNSDLPDDPNDTHGSAALDRIMGKPSQVAARKAEQAARPLSDRNRASVATVKAAAQQQGAEVKNEEPNYPYTGHTRLTFDKPLKLSSDSSSTIEVGDNGHVTPLREGGIGVSQTYSPEAFTKLHEKATGATLPTSPPEPPEKFHVGDSVQHVDHLPGSRDSDPGGWGGEVLDTRVDPVYGREYLVHWGDTKTEVWAPENFLLPDKEFKAAHKEAAKNQPVPSHVAKLVQEYAKRDYVNPPTDWGVPYLSDDPQSVELKKAIAAIDTQSMSEVDYNAFFKGLAEEYRKAYNAHK